MRLCATAASRRTGQAGQEARSASQASRPASSQPAASQQPASNQPATSQQPASNQQPSVSQQPASSQVLEVARQEQIPVRRPLPDWWGGQPLDVHTTTHTNKSQDNKTCQEQQETNHTTKHNLWMYTRVHLWGCPQTAPRSVLSSVSLTHLICGTSLICLNNDQ